MRRQPRFRKGKKAFKAGRNTTAARRYQRAVEKYRRQKVMAMKMAMVAMTTAMSAARMKFIQWSEGATKAEKAIALVQEVVDTAQAITKILA